MSSINLIAMRVSVAFDNPWYLLLAVPAVAIILLPFFLLPSSRRKTLKKILPLALRLAVALVLVLIIAGIEFINTTDEQAVVILVDTSYSTESVQKEMEKNAKQIFDLVSRTLPVAVVAFGEDQVCSVDMNSIDRTFELDSVKNEATDIEAALDYAASLCPADRALRIILLSDGRQTAGDADSKAYALANQGVRIDSMYYDTTAMSFPEVQISSFTGDIGAYKNKEIKFTAEIKSNIQQNIKARLYDNGVLISTEEKNLEEGSNMLEFVTVPTSVGVHNFTLETEGEKDTVEFNNSMSSYVKVEGKASILLISEDNRSVEELVELLSVDNDVDVERAFDAPDTVVELCNYDQVILSNIQYYTLGRKFLSSLESYVSVYGRSLLVLGGKNTFMYGGMKGTGLEDMMPVSFDFDETDSEDNIALMLVLDCSSSMGGSNDYISIAKQGAINCLDALSDNDYAGVVSFSTEAVLQSPLLSATTTNKDSLTRIISAMKISSGTYYEPGLQMAYEELSKSDAAIKHIIFLSDGQPVDNNFYEIAIKASDEGITVSTIGLTFSSSVLEYLAMYGRGRYYYVESADELPEIMLTEAEQAKVDPLIEGEFKLLVDEPNKLTESVDFSSLPDIGGYLGTTLKENGIAHLITEKGHPVYSSWSYGQGTVACFASDLCGEWTRGWFDDDAGKTAISSLVESTLYRYHRDSSLIFDSSIDGDRATVTVKTAGTGDANTVSITVRSEYKEESFDLEFVYSGLYRATIPIYGEGVYEISVTEKRGISQVDTLETAMCVPYSKEYDAFSQNGKGLLTGVCDYSGGRIFEDINELVSVKVSEIELVYNPIVPFAIIAGIMFLIDTAVRKLRWKDVKKYLPVLNKK